MKAEQDGEGETRKKNFSQSKTFGSQEDKPPTENDLTHVYSSTW